MPGVRIRPLVRIFSVLWVGIVLVVIGVRDLGVRDLGVGDRGQGGWAGQPSASIAAVHLVCAIAAHRAQRLFLLISQVEARAGTPAIALFALLEFVLLLTLKIIDLTIEGLPHLLARSARSRRGAGQAGCKHQEGINYD
jgi:hypothetical protein